MNPFLSGFGRSGTYFYVFSFLDEDIGCDEYVIAVSDDGADTDSSVIDKQHVMVSGALPSELY